MIIIKTLHIHMLKKYQGLKEELEMWKRSKWKSYIDNWSAWNFF